MRTLEHKSTMQNSDHQDRCALELVVAAHHGLFTQSLKKQDFVYHLL